MDRQDWMDFAANFFHNSTYRFGDTVIEGARDDQSFRDALARRLALEDDTQLWAVEWGIQRPDRLHIIATPKSRYEHTSIEVQTTRQALAMLLEQSGLVGWGKVIVSHINSERLRLV